MLTFTIINITLVIANSVHTIKLSKNMSDTFNRIMKKMDKCMVNKKYKKYIHRIIQSCPVGLGEKVKFKWFTPSEIIKNKKKIRPVFYKTFIGIKNQLYLTH